MGKKVRELSLDFVFMLVGAILYGVSVNAFTAPNNIAPGGVTGISTMINYLTGAPIGLISFVINVPIVIWAIIDIGYKLVTKTIVAIVMLSISIDVFSLFVPPYSGDPILICIFAGLFSGLGLSLTFLRGGTTGGTDMIARLVSNRLRHLSMGKIMLVLDATVVVVSAFVFKSIENAMYACIVIFVCTKLIDSILYGADAGTGKTYFVISEKNQEIADKIMYELDRGVTYISSRGGYTNEERDMLFCAVRRFEVYKINKIIRSVDKNAFVIVGDAAEISGEGFKAPNPDDKSLKEIIKDISNKKDNQS